MTKENNNLKKKIYQMFIFGLDGENLKDNSNLIHALQNGLGGVIFFTQNIKTTIQFKKLIKDIRKEALISPLLSIDQEGGRVERTENLFGGKCFFSPKFAAAKGKDFLQEQTKEISRLLKDLGLNLNFAPVLDVNTNPDNPIIGERAFSDNPDEVIKFGKIVAETYLKNGIIPCAKHFPGHGDASVDSHIALPKIDLPLVKMEGIHIRPFMEVDIPMIMVAHLHCTAFDNEEIPSSLSKNVLDYLRNKAGYQGLVITDDMVMDGVNIKDSKIENVIKAIKAGVNIILYRNSSDELIQLIENLAQLTSQDKELLKNIELSYKKIIEFKKENKSYLLP